MTEAQIEKMEKDAARKAVLETLPPSTFFEMEDAIKKWMLVDDEGILLFICAMYVANAMKLGKKPVWAFIIGPSGGGKTAFLDAMHDLEACYNISMLTTNTFLSGQQGKGDASLLPKVNGKMLIFKDWTSILSMQRDAKQEIMGQFREIWDGHMRKMFGNGKTAEWEGRISILAASTQAVDLAQQQTTVLGERFINYRLTMPDRKLVGRRSLENDNHQEQMDIEMRNAVYSFFKGLDLSQLPPVLPTSIEEHLVDVSDFVTMARSGVIRDFGFKKEVIFVPMAEMPTRIVQQLHTLAQAMAMVVGIEYIDRIMQIIHKIAFDSVPSTNRMVMVEMAKRDRQSTKEIAQSLGYPTNPIHLYLENLALLGVCRRDVGGRGDTWTMRGDFADLLREYEGITKEAVPEEVVAADQTSEEYEKWKER